MKSTLLHILFAFFSAHILRSVLGLGIISLEEMRGKTAKELTEIRKKKSAALFALLDDPQANAEDGTLTGELTEEQRKRHDGLEADIRSIDSRLDVMEKRAEDEKKQAELERRARAPHFSGGVPDPASSGPSRGEQRNIARFSLGRALRCAANNQPLDGIEGEMADEGRQEARAAGIEPAGQNSIMISSIALSGGIEQRAGEHLVGTPTAGGNLVETSVGSLLDALFESLVFSRLGADINTGLVGNLQINRMVRGTAPAEKSEIAAADKHTITFQPHTLSPRRLPTFAEISKQLFLQSSERNLERRVTRHILTELRVAMEKSYVADILATAGIGAVVGGTNGVTPTYDHIVDIAGKISDANVDPDAIRYLLNTAVQTYLTKQPLAEDGSGNAVDSAKVLSPGSNLLAGRPYAVSNVVPSDLDKGSSTGVCSAILAGQFDGYTIAQFGGMEFIVDPFTKATNGMNVVHAAVYHDGVVTDPAKFSAMQDALTA